MEIVFRPMQTGEFRSYLDYFIPDYAAEISSNYGVPIEEAKKQALQDISTELEQGVHTRGHELLCIIYKTDVIGYLWYKPDRETRSVFINDFCILPPHQGKGYGKQALSAFEAMLTQDGFEKIGLRVAANNDRAHRLYQKGGFRETGVNMIKRIGKD